MQVVQAATHMPLQKQASMLSLGQENIQRLPCQHRTSISELSGQRRHIQTESGWLTWGVCLELKLVRRDGAGKRMRRAIPRAKDTRTVLQSQARLPCRGAGYATIKSLLRSSRSDHIRPEDLKTPRTRAKGYDA